MTLLAACGGGAGGTPSADGGSTPDGYISLPPASSGGQDAAGTGSHGGTGNTGSGGGAGSGASSGSGSDSGSGIGSDTANIPLGDYLNDPRCAVGYGQQANPPLRAGADPLRGQQWHLKNDGQGKAGEDLNVQPAWSQGKGENIRVAVIDDAIEVTHEDLFPNIVAGASYNYLAHKRGSAYPLPCKVGDSHGTAVAGVIAARDNNGLGGSGVAPRASLVGYNPIATGTSADIFDALTKDMNKNHIYNNSWGADDNGHFTSADAGLRSTIGVGLKEGRNGRGVIYVFAAGNGGCMRDDLTLDNTCKGTELSTNDGYVSQLGVMAICATQAGGKRANYSEPGANLLVCAPSAAHDGVLPGITTTGLKNSYTQDFGGSSAAAPMVSGVVALMLQANPQLSWRDVRLVLAQSARKVDPTSPGWTRFGGLNFHHEYGFGVADADAAVRLSRTWQSVGNSSTLKECKISAQSVKAVVPTVPLANQGNLAYHLPVTGGLSNRITVPPTPACDIRHIEHVDVEIQTGTGPYGHPDAGNLHMTLTSPSGQTSTLLTPHPCSIANRAGSLLSEVATCQGLKRFTFGLTRHMNEPAVAGSNRQWALNVVDRKTGRQGNLESWSLTLYGR
ncbi:MAG: S8 family serine peptidase [Lautropia sp.]|nr:S8 family serine peptidase [Lautropia sp.]